jgi:hypothetical protein
MPTDEELARELRALPERGPPAPIAERIRARARGLFVRRAASRADRVLGALDRVYGRVEPALAAGVAIIYLGWAVQTVLAIRP